MDVESLILVVNPGSASRKYALLRGNQLAGSLHFEKDRGEIICTAVVDDKQHRVAVRGIDSLEQAAGVAVSQLQAVGALGPDETIQGAAVRVVAPSGFFLADHIVDTEVLERLRAVATKAPLHIGAALSEIETFQALLPTLPLVIVSDSGFHSTKPDYAWNYAIDLDMADHHEIKRFGYHGISVASASRTAYGLTGARRMVVCHLGSGSSVSAVLDGKSIDNTMGYSPLEGLVMATRSGSIDPMAVAQIGHILGQDADAITQTLNSQGGLRGISGVSDDIRTLLEYEAEGHYRAKLALAMYVYGAQKAIGQMSAALGGIDALVFTATVGERSNVLRERIMEPLGYLGITLDKTVNQGITNPTSTTAIHDWRSSAPILVIPADEAREIARHARAILL